MSPVSLRSRTKSAAPLPSERLEGVSSWGGNMRVMSYVYRPSDAQQIADILALAQSRDLHVGVRGAGCSYGDASLNREEITVDLTRMNRILAWNPETGVMRVEGGVTIRDVWEHAIGDGWWPKVVPGTMFVTIGGALAMNIHGKNHVQVGPIGEWVHSFDLLLPSGELRTCTPTENADLFYAAIGGIGILGIVTAVTLQLGRVYSGRLHVTQFSVANWDEMFAAFRARTAQSDYLIGWTDCFADGASAGRGLLQQGNFFAPGEDPEPARTLNADYQALGDELLGFFPKASLHRLMGPVFRPRGMRAANAAQYLMGSRKTGTPHDETHAAFAFRLDYVPNWKRAYGPDGLLQYQTFLPDATAQAVFTDQIARCQAAGLVPLLGVFKRHRADNFLMSYALDGWSFALDFRRTRDNHDALLRLFADMDSDVIAAGGRYYFAKDSHLQSSRMSAYLAEPRVQQFRAIKRAIDPKGTLQTDLYRRVFL